MPKEILRNSYSLSKTAGRGGNNKERKKNIKFKSMCSQRIVYYPMLWQRKCPKSRVRQKQWNALSWIVYSSSPRPAAPSDLSTTTSLLVSCFPLPQTVSCSLHSSPKM